MSYISQPIVQKIVTRIQKNNDYLMCTFLFRLIATFIGSNKYNWYIKVVILLVIRSNITNYYPTFYIILKHNLK
ncbi:hypothetical protein BDC45DRAFT_71986 [Circinella umbellata]|nr:hypothetical protein BDC45DRAFT_71986 [Circinella umbellata]